MSRRNRHSGIPILAATLVAGTAVLAWLLAHPEAGAGPSPEDAWLAAAGVGLDLPDGARLVQADPPGSPTPSAVFSIGEDRLRVRVEGGLDAGAAAARVKEERALLDGLFEGHQAPYPGELSNTLACPDRFRPAEIAPRGGASHAVRLYANDRLAFGGCSDDLLRFRATVAFHPCETARRLARVEYFARLPVQGDRAAALADSFRCLP